MKIYLDTTILTVYLFGQQLHSARHVDAVALFATVDAGLVEAVVSLYALQELCSYCYNTFPPAQAPHATRLAVHELLRHPLQVVPLLTRADRILFSRRFPMSDTSDQVHTCTAYREGCTAVITYDHHYQEVATLITVLAPAEFLQQNQ
jgi:predicted nucleic acid-binding protein